MLLNNLSAEEKKLVFYHHVDRRKIRSHRQEYRGLDHSVKFIQIRWIFLTRLDREISAFTHSCYPRVLDLPHSARSRNFGILSSIDRIHVILESWNRNYTDDIRSITFTRGRVCGPHNVCPNAENPKNGMGPSPTQYFFLG